MDEDELEPEYDDLPDLTWDFERWPGRGFDDSAGVAVRLRKHGGEYRALDSRGNVVRDFLGLREAAERFVADQGAEAEASVELVRDLKAARRAREKAKQAALGERIAAVMADQPQQSPAEAPIVWRSWLERLLGAYDDDPIPPDVADRIGACGELVIRKAMLDRMKHLKGELVKAGTNRTLLERVQKQTREVESEAKELGLLDRPAAPSKATGGPNLNLRGILDALRRANREIDRLRACQR